MVDSFSLAELAQNILNSPTANIVLRTNADYYLKGQITAETFFQAYVYQVGYMAVGSYSVTVTDPSGQFGTQQVSFDDLIKQDLYLADQLTKTNTNITELYKTQEESLALIGNLADQLNNTNTVINQENSLGSFGDLFGQILGGFTGGFISPFIVLAIVYLIFRGKK